MEQNNSISSAYRKNFDSVQNNVSTELRSENNIAKILCTNAKATISGFEALNGELRFNGEVCFMVTSINEDGDFYLAGKISAFPASQFDPTDFYIYFGEKNVGEIDKDYLK